MCFAIHKYKLFKQNLGPMAGVYAINTGLVDMEMILQNIIWSKMNGQNMNLQHVD